MPYSEHPVFNQPDEEVAVWRYYTSTQLISVFQNRGLYFNRSDKFSDPFEGVPHRDALIQDYIRSAVSKKTDKRLIDEGIATPVGEYDPMSTRDRVFQHINTIRQRAFLNCWHQNNSESITMWNSYVQSGDGVLIKSTYDKLKSALDVYGDYTFYMGEVGYLPWLKSGTDEELSDAERTNAFSNLVNKQEEYASESEFRVVANLGPTELEDSQTGFFMPTDLNEMIDEVRISPDAPPWCTTEFWENILRKYKIRAEVRHSSLNQSPTDLLDDLNYDKIEEEVDDLYEEWVREQDYLDS
ncbi:hypothetical protein [Halobaculum lipolyticum]|uniref:hypothetical protein n=1 Tax=Halobaculum lipolyticum TaxID=3032001 RepID=UPI0024C2B4EE|nr:hypothetical protein [Halobaculum sp. DT31]